MLKIELDTKNLDIRNIKYIFICGKKYIELESRLNQKIILPVPHEIFVEIFNSRYSFRSSNGYCIFNFIGKIISINNPLIQRKKIFLKGMGFKMHLYYKKCIQFFLFELGYEEKIWVLIDSKIVKVVFMRKNAMLRVYGPDSCILGNFINSVLKLRPTTSYKLKGFFLKRKNIKLKPIKKRKKNKKK